MKIQPTQLAQHLESVKQKKNKISPVYIVSGDEPLQVEECCALIRKQSVKAGFEERVILNADGAFDWSRLQDALTSLSLFSQAGTFVELRINVSKIPAFGTEIITRFCQQSSFKHVLLIISHRIERAVERKKWFTQVEKVSIWVTVWPIEHAQLPNWIRARLKQAGLQAEPDAVNLLSERVEGNLLAAVQEIEKLKLLGKDHIITVDCIRDVVTNSAHYDIFALTDAILVGDESQIVRTFYGLLAENKELTFLLWSLARELRFMCTAARKLAQGQNLPTALKAAGTAHNIQPFTIKKRQRHYQRTIMLHNEYGLRLLINKASELDVRLKTGDKYTSRGDELLTLALLISGNRSLHLSELITF